LQDRANWLNRIVVRCNCNRDTLAAIAASGFEIDEVAHDELQKAPPFARPLIVGSAVAANGAGG
jgi:hypothetical protein